MVSKDSPERLVAFFQQAASVEMSEMTKRQTFWHETFRTVAFGILASVGTYAILEPLEKKRDEEIYLNRTEVEIGRAVIDDFCKSSYIYTARTADAFDVTNRTLDIRSPNSVIKAWEGNDCDQYRSDLNRMSVYFTGLDSQISNATLLWKEQKTNFDEQVQKDKWDEARQELKQQNDDIAKEALKQIHLLP
jgi:hypothetical protein